jgi:hypothetical protein
LEEKLHAGFILVLCIDLSVLLSDLLIRPYDSPVLISLACGSLSGIASSTCKRLLKSGLLLLYSAFDMSSSSVEACNSN